MKGHLGKFSGTLIAALVLVLLACCLYFFQIREPAEEDKQRVFPTISSDKQINGIDLKYPLYTVVCRKDGERWFIFEDSKKFRANDKTLSNMAESIYQMKIEKVISENIADLAGFGLDNPEAEVTVKTPDKEYRVLIGGESPTGSGKYVRIGNDTRVLLVSENSVEGFLRRSANDLRDKKIVGLEEDKINKLNFRSKDSSFEIEKKDGKWAGKNIPEYVEIDQARVGAIIGTFANLKIDNFEDNEPKNLVIYGLDKPSAEIELFEDTKSARVLFGNKKEKGDYYVKLGSEAPVYSVSEFVFRQVPESVNDIRVRKVVEVDDEKVSALEIKRRGSKISILKKGNNWEVDSNKNVDESKIQKLLEGIEGLGVEKFVNDSPNDLSFYGLDKPEVELAISEANKKKTLLFGKKEDKEVYTKLADGKSVYLVSDEILSKIPSSKDTFIKK